MPVVDVVFQKTSDGGGLYWLQDGGASAPVAWAVAGTGLPDRLTLDETWNGHPASVYALLPALPVDAARFAAELAGFIAATAGSGLRFVWVSNPDAAYPTWTSHTLSAANTSGTWRVGRLATIDLINYGLTIGGGCPIVLQAQPSGDRPAGFSFTPAGGQVNALRFTADWGRLSFPETRGRIDLPFSGERIGSFGFEIVLPADPADPADPDAPMARLDVGLRYFIDEPDFAETNLLRSLRYPVLLPVADMPLHGSLDPVRPTDPARSYLALLDTAGTGAAIPSTWRTALGHAVALQPQRTDADAGARLVFAANPPGRLKQSAAPLYLTLEGCWRLAFPSQASVAPAVARIGDQAVSEPVQRIMPGAAATEYLGIMQADGTHSLLFQSGHPAFTDLRDGAESSLTSLDGWATTAWLYAESGGSDSIVYYAQPDGSEFFHAPVPTTGALSMGRTPDAVAVERQRTAAAAGTTGLILLEVPAAALPPPQAGRAFPAAPYAGVQTDDLTLYKTIELAALSPVRRRIIRDLPAGAQDPRPTVFEATDTAPVGFTPQGLRGSFSPDLLRWQALTLARTLRTVRAAQPQLIEQELILADVAGPLKAAFQTNQLFLVLSDPAAVLQHMSVTFRLTQDSFGEFKESKGPDGQSVPPSVSAALVGHGVVDTPYPDLTAYEAALAAALTPAERAVWQTNLIYFGAYADVTIADWLFHLSPYRWDWNEHAPTIAVFKYAGRSLSDLADDLPAWTWIEGAGGPTGAPTTQARLRAIIDGAIDAARKGSIDFADFAATALNPAWNGVLFFNVPVSVTELPPQLQCLAAGIDATRFYAHHIGINTSPIRTDVTPPDLANSTLFGLIHYEDPNDIPYDGKDYDFKVVTLSVVFRNSEIASFTSRVEVQINVLFGEAATLQYGDNGNNIVLSGSYQQHGEASSYVFVQSIENVFDMASFVLDTVDVLQVSFSTAVPANPALGQPQVQCRFAFSGILRFRALPSFDVFSYGDGPDFTGGLRFDNLILEMDFDQSDPVGSRSFGFRAGAMGIDLAASAARPNSLVNHFPMSFQAFLQGTPDKTPADLGYMAVTSPIPQGRMEPPWWGLTFQLELGSLGALAASAGLTASLIAAWSTKGEVENIYVGLKMPGSVGAQTRIPIEGILNLNFKKIELVVSSALGAVPALPPGGRTFEGLPAEPPPAGTQYMLKFRGVSLSLLTLSFPPGDVDVYLFGNPATGDASLLGWYAAYVKSE